MHFGEPLDDARLETLLRPGDGIDTVMSADAYGAGEADRVLGRALKGVDRESYCLIGAIGHDFYEGEREGAKGFPRFTDPRLRGEDAYGDYIQMATERSLERLGVERFDLLLLHNPDRVGYTSDAVWAGMAAVRDAGLDAPARRGPRSGQRLHARSDRLHRALWRADRLGDGDPLARWSPGRASWCSTPPPQHDVSLITRVVDYGGLFHDDVRAGHSFAEYDHRKFRPDGWVELGNEKLERMRPYAERHGLSLLQLACQWNLAHPAVRCVAPTLIQETDDIPPTPPARSRTSARSSPRCRPISCSSATELDELRAIGDNTGSMALKGANPAHEGEPRPDRWGMSDELAQLAARWEIAPERDLAQLSQAPAA